MQEAVYHHHERQHKDCIERAMLEIQILIQRSSIQQIDRNTTYKISTYAKTAGDHDQIGRQGKRTDHPIERKGSIQDLQVQEPC